MRNKGITLISLVVTIIILLILAGVTINLVFGENGIFKIAEDAGEKHKIEQIKEQVEIALLNEKAKKIKNGETLTVEQALIELNENNTFSEIDQIEQTGTKEGYVITLGYNESGEVIITDLQKDLGIRLIVSQEPKGYTNGKVTLTIKVSSSGENISNIEAPVGMTKKAEGTYEIENNGTYKIKATLSSGQVLEKEIKIATIDRLVPKNFTLEIKKDGGNITIAENAEDEEATLENSKSGIDHYEYFVIDQSNKETKYETNQITGLALGTYKIYAIAYDKAGNKTKSEESTIEITMVIDKLESGSGHFLAIDKQGNLWVQGYNSNGQLGLGNKDNIFDWTQVMKGTKFKEIDTAESSSYAIDIDGNLYSWGRNYYGNLGDGTKTDAITPVKIKEGTKFKKVDILNEYNSGKICAAIDINDNLWIWGKGCATTVNDETIFDTYEPVKILENIKFKEISVGDNHYLAIDENGNLWTWGSDGYGKLGRRKW